MGGYGHGVGILGDTIRPREITVGFANKDPPQTIAERVGTKGQVQDELSREIPSVGHATTAEVKPETGMDEEVATIGPPVNKRRKQMRLKRVNDEAEANAPPKGAPTVAKSVSDPDPLSYTKPQPSSRVTATEIPTEYVATTEVNVQLSVGSPESGKSTSVSSVVGSPGGIYQPGWGVTNDCRLDTPDACQDMVDHIVPPGDSEEDDEAKKDKICLMAHDSNEVLSDTLIIVVIL
ncbi:hypothetical protein Tco_0604203 [Tanacetum coccineum]